MAERKKKSTTAAAKRAAGNAGASVAPAALTQRQLPFVQLGQDIFVNFTGEWNEQRVKSLLSDVANRKRPIESAMLDVLGSVRTAVEKSFVEVQGRTTTELELDKAYREQLSARSRKPKRAPARKGDLRLTGQVVHPETGKPVPGVVVEAADKDRDKHDLLGVAITDDQGRFEFSFKESGEKEPEIMLRIGPDRRRTFYVSEEPVALKSEGQESITFTVPKSRAAELDAFLAGGGAFSAAKRTVKANEALTRRAVGEQVLSAVGPAALSLLAEGVALLQRRLDKAGSEK